MSRTPKLWLSSKYGMLESGICKGAVVRHFNWSKITFNVHSMEIMTKEGPGIDYELGVVG